MDTILSSQPATYVQLIKRSMRLYRASSSYVIFLSFLLAVTTFIPRFISDFTGHNIFIGLPLLSPYHFFLLIINLVSLMFFIGIIWHMYCVVRAKHEPFIEDIAIGAKKVLYVFVATIIQSLIIFGIASIFYGLGILFYQQHLLESAGHYFALWILFLIFVAQFVLILYASVLFIFFIPLIAIENKGILSAFEKSVSLAWNHWWRVFSVQATPWITYLIVLVIIRKVFNTNLHIYFMEYNQPSLWLTILTLIIFALFIPWIAASLVVQLKDLELRKALSQKK